MNAWKTIQSVLTVAGAVVGYFLGGCDGLLIALLVMIGIDYITGVMCAIINHELSSEIGFKGIFKKVLILILVGVANIIDVNVIAQGSMLRTATIFFYISNEGISILENAAMIGLPIPQKIKDVLQQLRKKADEE